MRLIWGAEEMIAAEQGSRKIAIEIKSFVVEPFVYEFHSVLGQFLNYYPREKGLD